MSKETMKCEFCRVSGIWEGDVETENGPMAVQTPCFECQGTGEEDLVGINITLGGKHG